MAYTYQEVGARVRQRKPEAFQGIQVSDEEIGRRVVQRNPQLASLIAPETPKVPKEQYGAGAAAKDVAIGVGKSGLETARGASSLGERFLRGTLKTLLPKSLEQKIGLTSGATAAEELIPESMVTATNTAQKVGKFGGDVAQFLIPGGGIGRAAKALEATSAVSKLGKYAPIASRVIAEGAGGAGLQAVKSGELNGDVALAGAVGAGFPLVGKAVGATGRGIGKALGVTTGTNDAIQRAISNPEAVRASMRRAAAEGSENAIKRINNDALNSLKQLKQVREETYVQGLKDVEKGLTKTKSGKLYVKRELTPREAKAYKTYVPGTKVGVPTKLDTQGVKSVFTKTAKKFGATGKRNSLDFGDVAINDIHIKKLQKLQDRIYNWKDTSPTGLNRLRQVIDSYKLGGINMGSSAKKFNKFIGDLRTNLSEYVGTRIPAIAEMNRKFASQSKVIEEIVETLKLSKGDPQTALRKMLNVFSPKARQYREVLEELGTLTGRDLLSEIAGLALSDVTPQGLAKYVANIGAITSIANPANLAVLPLTSPRLVGEAVTAASQFGRKIPKQAGGIGKAVTRAAISQ